MNLEEKISDKTIRVGIVGLGYVGIPLSLGFANQGIKVIGFDVDQNKIKLISNGESYIKHIPSGSIAKSVSEGNFLATSNFGKISEVDCIILCVPTPLNGYLEPDLSYVESTLKSIAPYLRKEQVVSLESTTYPGTTTEVVQPIIESSGLKVGEDISLVYSPEREDPGNKRYNISNITKVISGKTNNCLNLANILKW